jgi:hypothetical protein
MFASIPQRLTAPFGLLGDDAKLAFRSQPGGIAKLITTRVCIRPCHQALVVIIFLGYPRERCLLGSGESLVECVRWYANPVSLPSTSSSSILLPTSLLLFRHMTVCLFYLYETARSPYPMQFDVHSLMHQKTLPC